MPIILSWLVQQLEQCPYHILTNTTSLLAGTAAVAAETLHSLLLADTMDTSRCSSNTATFLGGAYTGIPYTVACDQASAL